MRTVLSLLLLFAFPLSATDAPAASCTPSPCATPDAVKRVCTSFPQSQIAEIAALRGYDVSQEWVDAHWKELMTALGPTCEKATTCFATPGNDYLFCNDLAFNEGNLVCDRFEGRERERCIFTLAAYFQGQDRNSRPTWQELQECGKTHTPPGARVLEYQITPAHFDESYGGSFLVTAVDKETRVPLQARLMIQSATPIYADDVPNGQPTTFYKVPWKPKLARIANAQGHRDVVPPEVRIEREGYRTETFRLPIDVPKMKVTMNPPASKLKKGKNLITVTATDAVTGKPVEARVMGGTSVLGNTNAPFTLELKPGAKAPEIWVTSLFDRYSDVVVAPAKK